MITRIDPVALENPFPANGTITVYGKNLDTLPDDVCMCCAANRSEADLLYSEGRFMSFRALPVLERSDTHIVFYHPSSTPTTLSSTYYPYFLTSPHSSPRTILYDLGTT